MTFLLTTKLGGGICHPPFRASGEKGGRFFKGEKIVSSTRPKKGKGKHNLSASAKGGLFSNLAEGEESLEERKFLRLSLFGKQLERKGETVIDRQFEERRSSEESEKKKGGGKGGRVCPNNGGKGDLY